MKPLLVSAAVLAITSSVALAEESGIAELTGPVELTTEQLDETTGGLFVNRTCNSVIFNNADRGGESSLFSPNRGGSFVNAEGD